MRTQIKQLMILTVVFTLGTLGAVQSANSTELQSKKMVSTSQAKEQVNCPVLGGKIDKKVFIDYKGRRIYFCCAGCIEEFKKDPEKYLKILDGK